MLVMVLMKATEGTTATRVIGEVCGVNRVVYDVPSQPPGAIEWD